MKDSARKDKKLDVEYVARLARLDLSGEELAEFQSQLEQVVSYVDKIQELNLDGIVPTSHAHPVTNVFREDEVCESLDVKTAMKNAPAASDNQFLVPKIIE